MQLLPSNSSLQEQTFAQFLDEMAKEDYGVLSICPLECKASLLPHLALWVGVDISDLEESEAREYIKKAIQTKTKKGTVGAVEEVLKSIFSEAVLKEWFEDDSLKKGEFKAHLTIKPDPALKYGEKKFEATKRLINQTKNVRSHFAGFDVALPPIEATVGVSTLQSPVSLQPFVGIDECIESGFEIKGGYIYEPTFKTDINELLSLDEINIKGGYKWQLEV